MNDIGTYLKEARMRCKLSLKDVYKHCGITDSKLSRMERGKGKLLDAAEFRKLTQLYGISVVPIYIMAGYLDENELFDYQLVFEHADLLNEDEKQGIQMLIDLFTKGRRV